MPRRLVAQTLCCAFTIYTYNMHNKPGSPPKGSTTGGVEGGVVVGQVHEAVHQVWLAHVGGQGAQLLVGGQAAAPRSLPHGPLLKHLGFTSQLYSSALPGTTYIINLTDSNTLLCKACLLFGPGQPCTVASCRSNPLLPAHTIMQLGVYALYNTVYFRVARCAKRYILQLASSHARHVVVARQTERVCLARLP